VAVFRLDTTRSRVPRTQRLFKVDLPTETTGRPASDLAQIRDRENRKRGKTAHDLHKIVDTVHVGPGDEAGLLSKTHGSEQWHCAAATPPEHNEQIHDHREPLGAASQECQASPPRGYAAFSDPIRNGQRIAGEHAQRRANRIDAGAPRDMNQEQESPRRQGATQPPSSNSQTVARQEDRIE